MIGHAVGGDMAYTQTQILTLQEIKQILWEGKKGFYIHIVFELLNMKTVKNNTVIQSDHMVPWEFDKLHCFASQIQIV